MRTFLLFATLLVACKDKRAEDTGTAPVDADGDGADETEDCDDQEPEAHPGHPECCDGIDNDCDGEVDEELLVTSYADADGDGAGDPAIFEVGCEPVEDWASAGDDCDDADPTVYTGAPELCNDGRVNDCAATGDGTPCAGSLAFAWAVLEGDNAGDETGRALADAGDVNGDGMHDLLVGAPGETTVGVETGAVYLVRGGDPGVRSVSEARLRLAGAEGDGLGTAVAGGGDLDGDGLDDLLVGAPEAAISAGEAYVVPGTTTGKADVADVAWAWLVGESTGDGLGGAVAAVPDLDGDGFDELLVGVPGASWGLGSAWVALGGATGALSARARWVGTDAGGDAGTTVAAADLDGDGLAELAVGAPGSEDGGAVYVLDGSLTGTLSLADARLRVGGVGTADEAGVALRPAGDVNGDGFADLVLGAPGYDAGAGAAFVFLGGSTGATTLDLLPVRLAGAATGDRAGTTVDGAGDLDGDGIDDLVVGAPDHDQPDTAAGAAYLVVGVVSGTTSLGEAVARFEGVEKADFAGQAVAGAGDVDGDGVPDVAVGVPSRDLVGDYTGSVYLLVEYGP